MNDTATTVDTYLAMWNEDDPARRAELIAAAWSPDCTYLDPKLEAAGHAGLSEMVDTVHGLLPGYRFRRTSGIDTHHDLVRFGWELVGPEGDVYVAGIDVGHLDGDGRLTSIQGFFGDLAAEEVAA